MENHLICALCGYMCVCKIFRLSQKQYFCPNLPRKGDTLSFSNNFLELYSFTIFAECGIVWHMKKTLPALDKRGVTPAAVV